MGAPFKLLTVAMARAVAQAHADAGLQQFNTLQAVAAKSRNEPQSASYVEHVHHAVPAATSLAFAAELFLKVVHFQSFHIYPHEHDLVKIYQSLPAASRDSLGTTYGEMYRRDLPMNVVHFALAAGHDSASIPAAAAPDLPTIDLALSHLRDVFTSWRYIYETMEAPTSSGIHFKALLCLIDALHVQIDAHKGGGRVEFGAPKFRDSTVV